MRSGNRVTCKIQLCGKKNVLSDRFLPRVKLAKGKKTDVGAGG